MRDSKNIPVLTAGTPYRYQSDAGRQNISSPTNIIKKDNYYYTLVGGSVHHGHKPGYCLYRTDDITDATHWRAWKKGERKNDGFVIKTVNPYTTEIDPEDYICTTIYRANNQFNSLTYNKKLKAYLLIGQDPNWNQTNKPAVIYSTSQDLKNWTPSQKIDFNLNLPDGSHLDKPSLIDPTSQTISGNGDRNYQYSGSNPYLYFILDHTQPRNNRDIVRYPVVISP